MIVNAAKLEDENAIADCMGKVRDKIRGTWRAKFCGLSEDDVRKLAFDSLMFTEIAYRNGLVDPQHLKHQVRARVREEYGSIVVMILFTIIWEIIKQWLFD